MRILPLQASPLPRSNEGNEPEIYTKIAKIMLPKDYINYILTGIHSCDYSDASGMLLMDVGHICWSKEMLEICGISETQMPKIFESYDCIDTVDPEIAKALGISGTVKVCAGAEPTIGELYTKLYEKSMEGDPDCGGILVCNYMAGEGVTHMDVGRPMVARRPKSKFTLANFFRVTLYSTVSTLKIAFWQRKR